MPTSLTCSRADVAAVARDGTDLRITLGTGQVVGAHSVLLAPGSTYRRLGVPGEEDLTEVVGDARAGATKQLGSAVGDGIAALIAIRSFLPAHSDRRRVEVNA